MTIADEQRIRCFLDTNIVCYAFIPSDKQERAKALLFQGPVISVQTLNEFALVSRRKWKRDWEEIAMTINVMVARAADLRPLDLATHDKGRELAERYHLHIYDAMIVSAAFLAGCDTLYSEDMQDGMIIENRMIIRNPFV